MVYFIRQAHDGPIKIGYTARDIASRVKELQTGSAAELHVLGAIEGTTQTESALHLILAPYKIHGDWFEASETVVGIIKQCLADKYLAVPLNPAHQSLRVVYKTTYFVKRPTKGPGRVSFAIIERVNLPDGTFTHRTVKDARLDSINKALRGKTLDLDAAEAAVQTIFLALKAA